MIDYPGVRAEACGGKVGVVLNPLPPVPQGALGALVLLRCRLVPNHRGRCKRQCCPVIMGRSAHPYAHSVAVPGWLLR